MRTVKYLILTILLFFYMGCSESTKVVRANIVYIEPYKFKSSGSCLDFNYKQGAWIKELNSNDSIAVLFDIGISHLEDISQKYSLYKPYKFRLRKLDWGAYWWILPNENKRDSGKTFYKRAVLIKSDIWLVESIRGYE
jgi:hypothetical protein